MSETAQKLIKKTFAVVFAILTAGWVASMLLLFGFIIPLLDLFWIVYAPMCGYLAYKWSYGILNRGLTS